MKSIAVWTLFVTACAAWPVVTFIYSLPLWCANPTLDGNWIVIALGFCA